MSNEGDVKPAFNPDAAYQPAQPEAPSGGDKPAFNPNAAFEPATGGAPTAPEQGQDSLLEQAGTAFEQGLSGITGGLSKVAETHGIPAFGVPGIISRALGTGGIPAITTPEAIAAREAKYPITSTVSNIGGTAGLIAATGGLGGLAPGAGLAARVGLGALEGAGIGGVNTATDSWSQNKPLDAQKIAASAGLGAVLGGAGPIVGSSLKAGSSGVGRALKYFNGLAEGAAAGEGYTSGIAKAYLAAGSKAGELVNGLTDNLSELYNSGKSAVNSMYEGASQAKLGAALEAVPVTDAKQLAQRTIEKVRNLTVPGEGEELGLSRSSSNAITSNLEKLSQTLGKAETSLDVHNALSDFATGVDKGIKFDAAPTAANQADREIIGAVRSAIRGDLKSPTLWGDAAPVYSELSSNYNQYKSAKTNFERDFMKTRIAPNGQKIKVVDPSKINTFFKNNDAPGQILRNDSLDSFIEAGTKNAHYANEFQGYQQGLDDLASQVSRNKDFLGKADVLAKIKKAKTDHHEGLATFAILEKLPVPVPIKAAALALKRYVGSGGNYILGSDLGHAAQAAGALAKSVDAVTNKIGGRVNALLGASASEARKAN